MHKNNIAFALSLPERLGVCVDRVGGKRALSNLVLVSESQIFRYLNGLTDVPSDKLLAIARAAKVDAGWLLSGEGDMLGGGGASIDARPAFRGELLVQITQLFEELLVEFEKPFNPRQRARAITFLYNALRHEETMRGIEYQPNKFDMLKSLNYLAELRTEEELEILTNALTLLEYENNHNFSKEELELLRTWVNLTVRGTKGYYSSYSGQVYFERKSGGQLEPSAVLDLQNLVTHACKHTGKTELDWLDVGCGSGRHLVHLTSHYPNLHLKGLELSELGFNICDRLMQSEKLPKQCVSLGDARQLPFVSDSFDVTFTHLSLYCLPYIPGTGLGLEEAFSEIIRVTRKGGLIKASFPMGYWRDYSMSYQFMNQALIEKLAADFSLEISSCLEEALPPAPMRLNHDKYIHVIFIKK